MRDDPVNAMPRQDFDRSLRRMMRVGLAWIGAVLFLTAAPASAASCGNYTPVGSLCSRTVYFGWGTAGSGTQSVLSFLARPAVSGPVTFQVTQISSSLGAGYAGFFGIMMSTNGGPAAVYTSGQVPSIVVQPGTLTQAVVAQTCFDITCASAAPGAFRGPQLPNMFSMQLTITAASGADLDLTPLPLLNVQFISSGQVSFQEQEQALDVTTIANSARASVNEGASDFGRYYNPGGGLIEPYTSFSVTNPSATSALSLTVNLYDFSGDLLASIPLPSLPPLGAAGYLLAGQNASDPLALLPWDTLLPSGADDIFHGVYGVQASGPVIFLSQEFYGTSMLNAFIIH